jgi:hypothetical protein
MCGTEFLAYAHRLKRGLGQFCSRFCAGAHNGHARIKTTWQERFWSKIDQNGPIARADLGPCWIWTAARFKQPDSFEYGAFHKDGQNRPAHQVALVMQLGRPLGPCMKALHRCDVPLCVRNDDEQSHLFEGTQADNMRDMIAKGRQRNGHGGPSETQKNMKTSISSV